MAYPIRSTGGNSFLPILRKSGYGNIGVNQGGYGPTSVTGFWNGRAPNVGGYIVYVGNLSNSPTPYIVANDNDLITLSNTLGGGSNTTIGLALTYFMGINTICFDVEPPNVVTEGLILYLDARVAFSYPRMGTFWGDISRGLNTATLINGPTYSSAGGGCIVSDGVDDGVTVPDSPNLDISGSITLEGLVWFNQHKNFGSLLVKGPGGAGQLFNYCFFFYATSIVFGFGDGSNFYSAGVLTTPNVPINTWHHIVGVYNLSTLKFYLNGVLMDTIPIVATPYQNTDPLNVIQVDYPIDGKVALAKVYNRELSAAEVLQNYYAALQRFIPTNGLVLWLDGTNTNTRVISPTTAYDMSNLNYNSTFTNGAGLVHRDAGTSFNFDGVDDALTGYGTKPSFSSGITIDILVKPESVAATFTTMFALGSWNTAISIINNVSLYSSLEINNGNVGAGFISITTGVFIRFTITYDNVNIKTYKDGVLVNTTASAGGLTFASAPFPVGTFYSMGYVAGLPGYNFKGVIPVVRVYNRPLTEAEILTIYTAGVSRYT